MSSKVHLLIDGDVIAFMAAAASQKHLQDSYGWVRPFANVAIGEATVDNFLIGLKQGLKASSFEVILSDPDNNFRKTVDPMYKTNRVGERPILLEHLKMYLRTKHGAEHWPYLEADDVLSIRMTDLTEDRGGWLYVCVGRDKDFNSIPGTHHMIGKDVDPESGAPVTRVVTAWQATRWFLIQTLAGDAIDGFAGCPNIGMERAAKIIDNPVRLVPEQGVKTRGVNKGEAVTKWVAEPTEDLWACVVSHYQKAGLTEEDALRTARLARLLRHGDYEPAFGGSPVVSLWRPESLPQELAEGARIGHL